MEEALSLSGRNRGNALFLTRAHVKDRQASQGLPPVRDHEAGEVTDGEAGYDPDSCVKEKVDRRIHLHQVEHDGAGASADEGTRAVRAPGEDAEREQAGQAAAEEPEQLQKEIPE